MAAGVLSSGSTLMPPVHRTSSAPASRTSAMARATRSSPSSTTRRAVTAMPNSASFASTTGVNASCISPLATSLPVVTMPAVRIFQGSSSRRGRPPPMASARASFSSPITRGITRVPHSTSPRRTAVPPWRVAIISSPSRLIS